MNISHMHFFFDFLMSKGNLIYENLSKLKEKKKLNKIKSDRHSQRYDGNSS